MAELSESDICDRLITPALKAGGWSENQWRREFAFTDGRIIVRGKLVARGKQKRVDYLLFYKPNIPIAVVEAKRGDKPIGAGMQQAVDYAEQLDVPFVFTSNGDGFVFRDRTGLANEVEQRLTLDEFPSPDELWRRYKAWKGLDGTNEELVTSPNYTDESDKSPRYYQQLAINRTIEAVARGQRRLLLTMATGTGKTYTAFNIIWRLWKRKVAKRVLFLADRNILVDQTITNDFKPFGGVMKKLDRSLVDPNTGRVDTSYEIYLSLYQAIAGGEDREAIYDKFPRDFFDLIVIDECHRGSASADSAWRDILDYFEPAIQLGLTATPKETAEVSSVGYFGEPVFTYSLKQGIDDGFLAPYKVVRIDLDQDLTGWRPEPGQRDDNGELIEDRIYNQKDIDRGIVFPDRDAAVARRVSSFLHDTNPMNKTIIFCANVDHAERMRRAIINDPANRDLVQASDKYVMRITGDDEQGKAQLDNFIDPKEPYPVIATTSELMTTGVDAQTCHVIVLDQRIESMTKFKQVVGRGTRLRTDWGKHYFTILDFRKATELFADPEWDGPPLQEHHIDDDDEDVHVPTGPSDVSDLGEDDISEILDDPDGVFDDEDESGPGVTYVVGDVEFKIIAERVQYYDKDGKLVTETLRDYTRTSLQDEYESLDEFVRRWSETDRKQVILDELLERGVILEALEDQVGRNLDPFDLICHVAFDQPPLTRQERVEEVRKRDVFTRYGDQARAVLEALLDKYADQGIHSIEEMQVLQLDPFTDLGTPVELVQAFGGRAQYLEAVQELEAELYQTEAS